MQDIDEHQIKDANIYSTYPEAYGGTGAKRPTFNRDMIHKRMIDECENEFVVEAREQGRSIETTLIEDTRLGRVRFFPRKLDMSYNRIIENLGKLKLINPYEYYTGPFHNCIASGLVKGGLVGVGVGLAITGILTPDHVEAAKTFGEEYMRLAPSTLAICVGILGVWGAGVAIKGPQGTPNKQNAIYLDKRIKELYYTKEE